MGLQREMAQLQAYLTANSNSNVSVNELKALCQHLERQEYYSRRFNLVFEGFPETPGETNANLWNKMRSFLHNIMGLSSVKFDILHRLGSKARGHRRVIMKFISLADKNLVWESRRNIRNTPDTHYGSSLTNLAP